MLRLTSTLTGEKTEFTPHNPPDVLMYVCGVTPYSDSHVGHGMSYVIFDVVRRYLAHRGYSVRVVQNFTDVDDKIIARSQETGETSEELAGRYMDLFKEDMELLNVLPADEYPLATVEVPSMLEMISGLIDKGFAYAAGGDVYFRVGKFDSYGKLSHRTLDGMMAGARIAPNELKESPLDFTLWKGAKEGEPSWDSPWGPGRPGWHIECSAMSLSYLGEKIDIHGGGADLIFPHHENEIAQTEAFTGTEPFAQYWLHNGLLQMGEEKMSKSLGNLVSIRDVVEQHGADAFRMFVLTSHYRMPLTWTDDGVGASARAAERLSRAAWAVGGEGDMPDVSAFRDRFYEAMDDDLNTAQALAALFDMAREINRAAGEGGDVAEACALLRELGGVLGLQLEQTGSGGTGDVAPFVELLIETRAGLRKEKQFALADQLRDRLAELGVVLEDTPRGTEWRIERRSGE